MKMTMGAAIAALCAGMAFGAAEDLAVDYSWGQHCLTVKPTEGESLAGVSVKWKYTIDARVFASGEFDLADGEQPGAPFVRKFHPQGFADYTPMGWGEKFMTFSFEKDGREILRKQYKQWYPEPMQPRLPRCHTFAEWKKSAADGGERWTHGCAGATTAVISKETQLPVSLVRKGRTVVSRPFRGGAQGTAKTELLPDGAVRVAASTGRAISRNPWILEFGVPKAMGAATWFGLGPQDTADATVERWTAEVKPGERHAGVRWLELAGGGAKLRVTATEPNRTANFAYRIVDAGDAWTVVLEAAMPCAFVFDPYDEADELLLTRPYLQAMSTNGCTVALVTTREEPSLRLKWSGGELPLSFSKFPLAEAWLATARIEGLKPGTRVDYEVAGEKGSFRTWKEDGSGFKCAVFGDYQCGVDYHDWELDPMLCGVRMFNDMIGTERCEFAVGTGDVADTGDWEKEIRPLVLERQFSVLGTKLPSFMAFGNHDSKYPQNHFFYVNPPSGAEGVASFAFLRDNCLFVCLDDAECGVDVTPGRPAMVKWLEGVLTSETAKKAKFRFVFRHVPLFEEDFGNCDRSLIDLFSTCDVDCVFSGDHHGHARLERAGVRQIVNGCFGYFDHDRPGCHLGCNWYGDETKVGGHSPALTNRTWRFQKPGEPGVLGPETPINRGLFPGYATLEVRGDTATVRMLGFNADGSKIGVMDEITMKAGVRPEKKRGMAMERYCYDKKDWHCAYILTGDGGAVLEIEEKGPKVLRFRRPDATGRLVEASVKADFDTAKGVDDTIWSGKPLIDEKERVVGVTFARRKSDEKVVFRLRPDNSVEVLATGVKGR